jgi:Fe-S-cluster containining protein
LGAKIDYADFIKEFDKRLQGYFDSFGTDICCTRGCSECCEKGDYPLTDIELEYLMQGFMKLEPGIKIRVQENIQNMVKGEACPFLINKECSVYPYRPIVCRVHGLAYFYKDEKVKLPYCVNNGKNFSKVYDKNDGFYGKPLNINLDTPHVLEGLYNEMRNLYDWLKG